VTEYLISQRDDRRQRADHLANMRQSYRYRLDLGFPIAVGLREPDEPAMAWRLKSLVAQEGLRLNLQVLKRRGRWNFVNELQPLDIAKLASLVRSQDIAGMVEYFMPVPGGVVGGARERSIEEFREIFALAKPPEAAFHFESDEYFAENMVAGPDPTRLVRLTEIPAKFPITSSHLSSVPELSGEDLASAIAAGRVYWIDHEVMAELENGKHPQGPKYMYAPMVAFCVPRGGGSLRPFAIQCGQDPSGREIYTPADRYSWKLAKNCVLAAHNTYHEVLTHLGFTHLINEAILLSTMRNLALNHPLAVLLRRHFDGTLYINKLAVDVLIQPGRAVEYLIGSDLKSTYGWLAKHRRNYSFRENYLPTRLARARTDASAVLPHYPYRDDGLLSWNAIHGWVSDLVTSYYRTEADVLADQELQNWAAEIASDEVGRVRDFGATPGQIADRNDLIEILTMILWTAGPQHAAVNFAQREHMAFLPANPLSGYTPEPRGRDHTEADWLAQLPPLDVAVQQFCVMTFLGSIHHTVFGDYEHDFEATPVAGAHRRFVAALTSIEDEIVARNQRRAMPYNYLLPSKIPNSTNI